MALRNAFDNLGTESALRRIANLLTFARDSNDRIRVVVDNSAITVYNRATSTNMTNDNASPYQSSTSWNATDARDPLRQQYRANANFTAKNRWTY